MTQCAVSDILEQAADERYRRAVQGRERIDEVGFPCNQKAFAQEPQLPAQRTGSATRAIAAGSQERLAEIAELHRTYVGSIERAERNISIDSIDRHALTLGVDVSDLLSRE